MSAIEYIEEAGADALAEVNRLEGLVEAGVALSPEGVAALAAAHTRHQLSVAERVSDTKALEGNLARSTRDLEQAYADAFDAIQNAAAAVSTVRGLRAEYDEHARAARRIGLDFPWSPRASKRQSDDRDLQKIIRVARGLIGSDF